MKFLVLEYASPIGIQVCERYKVYWSLNGLVYAYGANLVDRKYKSKKMDDFSVDME